MVSFNESLRKRTNQNTVFVNCALSYFLQLLLFLGEDSLMLCAWNWEVSTLIHALHLTTLTVLLKTKNSLILDEKQATCSNLFYLTPIPITNVVHVVNLSFQFWLCRLYYL